MQHATPLERIQAHPLPPLFVAVTAGCPAPQRSKQTPAGFDPTRTARMFGFGFCWYGPYQYYWYALLEHLMPLKTTTNFITKVGGVWALERGSIM